MIDEVQFLIRKTKSKFHQDFSSFYDEMISLGQSGIFQFEEGHISKNAQGIAPIMNEALF